jgi:hypothetical protein
MHDRMTYPPLDTLKPVAPDVWIVDGQTIRFGPPLFRLPFPTRATILRLSGGALLVHSPTPIVDALEAEVRAIGEVRFIVAPTRIHYAWVGDWRSRFPQAQVWLAPRVREQAGGKIDFPANDLAAESAYPWSADVHTLGVAGDFLTEFVFFHCASRTLVLADLIENFEPKKLNPLTRLLTRIAGAQDPHGAMPVDLRATFRKHKPAFRASVEQMIAWNPERIILAHGRWYRDNAVAELKRAFRWLL